MGCYDETSMGGNIRLFLTTHWSLIEDIKSNSERNRALTDLLLQRYWKPVYFYIRRQGHDNERAKDLTQGFFHEVVLNRKLVETADSSRGRFRALLLRALERYLIDQAGKKAAKKRIPEDKLVSLDIMGSWDLPSEVSESSPAASYNYGWISALLDQILSQVQVKCREQDMEVHWHVFDERVVKPILDDVSPPSLSDICEKYDIENEKKASNMAITVKRCFQAALREWIRNTVVSEDDVSEELRTILGFFPNDAQHSKK